MYVSTVSTYSDGLKIFYSTHTTPCIDNVDKHSIQCIVCFDLRIDSIDKIPYSIHNSIALILCIDSVDKQDTILNTQ